MILELLGCFFYYVIGLHLTITINSFVCLFLFFRLYVVVFCLLFIFVYLFFLNLFICLFGNSSQTIGPKGFKFSGFDGGHPKVVVWK